MKAYFAKYLPDKDGKLIIKNVGGKEERIIGKLFLCSRDIQIGDKFQQNPASFPAYISTCVGKRDGFIICDEDRKWAEETVFKVVGEILTPKITENQEFTEKEIEFLTIGENIS